MSKIDVIQEKLDRMHVDICDIKDFLQLQDTRLGSLEQWRSWMMGGLCVLGLCVGAGIIKIFGG